MSVEKQIIEFHSISPGKLKKDTAFSYSTLLDFGSMQTIYQPHDTITTYLNRIAVAQVYKAILTNSDSLITYYNRDGRVIDKITLRKDRINILLKEKTDVFLLYRGWLELQRFKIINYIAGLKTKAKQFDKQHNATSSPQFAKVNGSVAPLLTSAKQFLEFTENKIDYVTTIDRHFVLQCLLAHYHPFPDNFTGIQAEVITYTTGNKFYELTDTRGNVQAVITDKRLSHTINSNTVDYYEPDIVAATDYAPFGAQLPGRKYSNGSNYRYGFNGKENDNEVKGEGNQQDYGMRIYDPRLGRFLSVDPLTSKYPELTPYQFASNRPIDGIDIDGLEFWKKIAWAISPALGIASETEITEGFKQRAKETVQGFVDIIKTGIKSLDDAPPTMGGINPKVGPSVQQLKKTNDALVNGAKAVINDYADLIKKASNGDKRAIGALGFEVILFALPGGEEAKIGTAIPRGFKSAEQFAKVGEEFAAALEKSGIKFEEIGVQGSSVTGKSFRTGEAFRWEGAKPSDIDAFVVLKEDIPITGGLERPEFIHPDKIIKKYPALKAWSKKWTKILNREITPAAIKPVAKIKP